MRQRSILNRLKTFMSAILAGVCISLGGAVYLSLDNKIVGSILFAVGLFVICTMGLNLFTGKVCYVFDNKPDYVIDVIIIWLGNLAGTFLSARLQLLTRYGTNLSDKAKGICGTKLGDNLLSIFILAVFCNIMIYIGVEGYKSIKHEIGKYISLFLGVVIFILCGFEHCIANMYYYTMADVWSINSLFYLIVMTIGNAVGGIIFPLIRRFIKASE